MNKKGLFAFDVVMWIPRIIILVLVIFSILFLLSLYTNFQFDFKDAEADIIMNAFITSPGGVGYLDPITGRRYQEIVDKANFNSERLESALYIVDNQLRAAKLTLRDAEGNLINDSILYNGVWYNRWAPIAYAKLLGAGSIEPFQRTFPVVIKDSDSEVAGFLDIELLMPK